MNLSQISNKIYPLPEASIQKLEEHISEVSFPKGHILLRANKVENSIYFIKKGIARLYTQTPDNEITFLFCKEGDTLVSLKSYVTGQKGYEDVELLEDCELYQLKTEVLEDLYQSDIHIANWGRKLAELELIKTEERFIARQFRTASERYHELLELHPDLIQRVQLGHIASYLGISQVSLSRIRAEIR